MTNVTIDIKGTATHNGGYRATAAAIDPYAARLVFQSVSVLIDAPMVVKPCFWRRIRPDLMSAVAGQDREGPLLAEGRLL